ncbi:MAG: glutathione S-transferase family protein, partial [Parvibaculaceae bacterium]
CRLDWQARKVDYFNGETRNAQYRSDTNEMGEVPVLEHNGRKLTQSGVILDYLAEKARKFGAKSEDERREIWRWILFDNHKFTSYLATLRFLRTFTNSGETPVTEFLRARVEGNLSIVDGHLASRDFMLGKRLTIADLSMCGYLYYGDELGVDLGARRNLLKWLDRIAAQPGWKHPYDLMPRAYPGAPS